MTRRGRAGRLAPWLLASLLQVALGCEAGGGGCLRLVTTEASFPQQRVLDEAVLTRVTQRGFDRIAARLKDFILAVFAADSDGRAIIPLETLGLGSLGTDLGPFNASLRDLVLTLDLSGLTVTLVPDTSPARIRVAIADADLGLAEGTLVGRFSTGLLSGDAACALANGPNGRVARLSLELALSLGTTSDGALDVRVEPSRFDLRALEISVRTACDLPECLDGLSAGSTSECGECASLCPASELVAGLGSALRDRLDGVFDALLNSLGDDLANQLLAGFLDGGPLAVEGDLPVGRALGDVLSWMRSANPLSVYVRPAANGIAVRGAPSGLDLTLDAGFDAAAHPCVGATGPSPTFRPGPRPRLADVALDATGLAQPYDVAFAVSDALVNAALHAAWRTGALCVDATTADLARLSGGDLHLGAPTIDLLLPGYAGLTGPDAPVRLSLSPRLDGTYDAVRFDADGVGLTLAGARLGIDAWLGAAWVRVLTFTADVGLRATPRAEAGGRLSLALGEASVTRLALSDDALFAGADLDVVAPFVVDLALGFLAARPIVLDLPTEGLFEGFGIDLAPTVVGVAPAGETGDWLAVYVALEAPGPRPRRVEAPTFEARVDEGTRGGLVVAFPGAAPEAMSRVRAAGGLWSAPLRGQGPHRIALPRAGLGPVQRFEAEVGAAHARLWREVTLGAVPDVTGPAARPAAGPPSPAPSQAADASPRGASAGCAGGGDALGLIWGLVGLAGLTGLRRRGLAWLAAWGLIAGGCARTEPPERRCDADLDGRGLSAHDQCDDGFICAASGRCEPTSACGADVDCCPGAVCASGWCRPTPTCGPDRPCEGVDQACEAGRCVARPCADDAGCTPGARCVGAEGARRCVLGAACGGPCGAGELCDLASGRCVRGACEAGFGCGEGTPVVGWREGLLDALACDAASPCACAEPPAPLAALPGVEPAVMWTTAAGAGPLVASWDSRARGLALATPDGPAVVIAGSGEGLGRNPVFASGEGRAEPRPAILFQDAARRGVDFARADLATRSLADRHPLPVPGESGRFQALVRLPAAAGGGLVALAFAEEPARGGATSLFRFNSNIPEPATTSDWSVTLVVETPGIPRAERPCDGSCGLFEVCVRRPDGDVCASPALVPPPSCDACNRDESCGTVRGEPDATARCLPRVEPERRSTGAESAGRTTRGSADGPLPAGAGLFVTAATGGGPPTDPTLVAAWWDARDGAIVLWGSGAVSGAPRGTGRLVLDRGLSAAHLSLAAGVDGRLGLAFEVPELRELRYAEADGPGGPFSVETVGEGGAWARLVLASGGEPRVLHGSGREGHLRLAARGVGADGAPCWAETELRDLGALVAGAALVAAPDGELWAATRTLAFASLAVPGHGLATRRVSAPTCR
jgi:hypothetical protein